MDSGRSYEKGTGTQRTKKSVKFSDVQSTKPTTVSTERVRSKGSKHDEDDISESIQFAEEISQSLRSHSVAETKKQQQVSTSQLSAQEQQDKFSPQSRDMREQRSAGRKGEGSVDEDSIEEDSDIEAYQEDSFEQSSKSGAVS